MLPLCKRSQPLISTVRPLAITTFLVLAGLLVTLYLTQPVRAGARIQSAELNNGTRQEVMENAGAISSTMSMAEMGAMMDGMMAQMESMMAAMPTTSTVQMSGMISMDDMGQMMQMMGMMHQYMGQMQMMGVVMSGDMMGEGMGEESATPEPTRAAPEATATVEPTTTYSTTEDSEPEVPTDATTHPAPTLAVTSQKATVGAVTVEATPLATEELLDISFAITVETHSVELDFDLAERATLTIGEFEFPATNWTPDAPSGHHVTGTLLFTIDHPAHASLVDLEEVTLELRDIDGQPVTLSFAVGEK